MLRVKEQLARLLLLSAFSTAKFHSILSAAWFVTGIAATPAMVGS